MIWIFLLIIIVIFYSFNYYNTKFLTFIQIHIQFPIRFLVKSFYLILFYPKRNYQHNILGLKFMNVFLYYRSNYNLMNNQDQP